MIARASSGSRSCSKPVELMMSTKSAVKSFRSPSGMKPESTACPRAIPGGGDAVGLTARAVPHWLQKRDPARLSWPQLVHLIGSAVPQALQNFAVSGFSASQFAHCIGTRISWLYMLLDHEWRPLSQSSDSGLTVPPRRRDILALLGSNAGILLALRASLLAPVTLEQTIMSNDEKRISHERGPGDPAIATLNFGAFAAVTKDEAVAMVKKAVAAINAEGP